MRASGAIVSTLGRSPVSSRKRSQMASLMRSVTNSRLRTGLRIAETFTRIVSCTSNHAGHGSRSAVWKMSFSSR